MKKIIVALSAVLGLVALAVAVGVPSPFINETGLTYSKRFVLDLQNAAVNTVSATANYSSATFSNSSFGTGQVSTGSFLVADNTVLSSHTATNALTVVSTSGSLGDSIIVSQLQKPGAYVFLAGRDWNYKATTALTAASIKLALDRVPYFATSRSTNILYSTANVSGSVYNGIVVQTNNPDTLAISSPTFLGGRDPITVTVNGYALRAGRDFGVGATAVATALNIKTAMNARSGLSSQITAAVATSSVTLQSNKVGTTYNFPLATSNSSGVSVLHPTMVGGTTGAWLKNEKAITVATHGYTLALPVLYRLGASAPVISGLTGETTYYVIPLDANTLELASSSANAQAGTAITLASTSTLTAAKSYSLLPIAFVAAATTGGKWQVSNDNSTWSDVSASTFSWIGGGSVAGSVSWNLGQINYRYLGLNVVAPTTGGLGLTVYVQGSYTP